MPVTFTDRFVKSLEKETARKEFFDAGCEGLRVRTGPRGLAFSQSVRIDGGKRKRIAVGTYPALPLKEARALVGSGAAIERATAAPDEAEPAPQGPGRHAPRAVRDEARCDGGGRAA
ncbi:Arm DNA-binding domain-containing protein [Acuticoccus mangrovi]|uniref:DUF4102 domain-containing protein n=1 Tax=Acuticoccus mangrovi TaxID=2796142 RepID=A0A934IPM5_9HYPH|nr:Arm DNA-binding domain-containing protein [Acuticoccus mangrovi]MBJ3776420.1 DUF4102 domain-containing protein [Acuticoccus mangrovi]